MTSSVSGLKSQSMVPPNADRASKGFGSRLLRFFSLRKPVFNSSDFTRNPGLFHSASFLTPKDQARASRVSVQFRNIFNSQRCWVQLSRTYGIHVRIQGITVKELVRDLAPMLMKNELLCGRLEEVEPQILVEAIKRIYVCDADGNVVRDPQGNLVYARDPVDLEMRKSKPRFVKDTFKLLVPRKTISITVDDRSPLRVDENDRLINDLSGQNEEISLQDAKRVLRFPLTPNNLGILMKEKYDTGYSHTENQVFEQHGDEPISQSLLFMKKDVANRGFAINSKTLISNSLTERIFFNFVNYAISKKFLDGTAITSTIMTFANGEYWMTVCGGGGLGIIGPAMLDVESYRGFMRDVGYAVGWPTGNSQATI